MPTIFLYLLKLSIGLAAVYLFYQLVLRRLTFYRYNRWYLLAYPLVCFIIPFIDVAPLVQQAPKATVLQWVPVLHQTVGMEEANSFNGWQLAGWVLAVGSVVLLGRLALQYLSLRQIKKQAVPWHTDGVTVYQVNKNIMPFSFANGIYVNIHNHSPEELQEIIRHEYVHVKQRHSADILLTELLCIVNWFNPFAWLLRHAIRQNLEFIADQSVVQGGVDKKAYQYLLLKVVGEPQFRIANQFNFSSLKKRITMMNKIKSTKVHLLKFLIALPLVAVLLLAFRQQFAKKPQQQALAPIVVNDTLPDEVAALAASIAAEAAQKAAMTASEKAFLARHPNVQKIEWAELITYKTDAQKEAEKYKPGPVLTVYLSNGKTEYYFLGTAAELERFKKDYGELPPTAPPPTPPVPAAPEVSDDHIFINHNKNKATVILKNGTTEQYNLNNAAEKKAFEQKYDMIVPPAPEAPQSYPAPAATPYPTGYPAPAAPEAPAAYPAPPPPPPAKLPKHIKGIQISNNSKATVTLKNGTIEHYNLNNEEESKAFQKKYGKLAPPPPPPPAEAAPAKGKVPTASNYQWIPINQLVKKKPSPEDGC